ncbi:MAG: hypothetical protein AB7P69_21155, partial [Candidatus Binatia bacterium]
GGRDDRAGAAVRVASFGLRNQPPTAWRKVKGSLRALRQAQDKLRKAIFHEHRDCLVAARSLQ